MRQKKKMKMKMKSSQKPKPHELIEHTADVGLRVFAPCVQGLYVNAAKGMFAVIAGRNIRIKKEAGLKRIKFELNIAARNREELLVGWLNELLTLFDIHDLIFTRFKINLCTTKQIKALAWAEPLNTQTYIRKTEIKAVTYHQLKIKKIAGVFAAEIIFDI